MKTSPARNNTWFQLHNSKTGISEFHRKTIDKCPADKLRDGLVEQGTRQSYFGLKLGEAGWTFIVMLLLEHHVALNGFHMFYK